MTKESLTEPCTACVFGEDCGGLAGCGNYDSTTIVLASGYQEGLSCCNCGEGSCSLCETLDDLGVARHPFATTPPPEQTYFS